MMTFADSQFFMDHNARMKKLESNVERIEEIINKKMDDKWNDQP